MEANDKMIKKFGMKVDFDEMEETVLIRLLMNQTKDCDNSKEIDREMQKLKVNFNFHLPMN